MTRCSLAVAARVLRQLRNDRRTLTLLIVVPCVLLTLLRYVFDSTPLVFQRIGPMLLAVFPFTVMFVVTSVAMLRERTTGTLERLLTLPIAKGEILVGYGLAFGAMALVQVAAALLVAIEGLGLDIAGSVGWLAVVAVVDALLGMALGLLCSAFARTEFQAVQFLPAFVFPQLLLCGLFVPREQMAHLLQVLSDVAPLTYAVDAVAHVSRDASMSATTWHDIVVVAACVPAALALGALTLRRRTG
jgi:ABC transporter DrrB family efflux protein